MMITDSGLLFGPPVCLHALVSIVHSRTLQNVSISRRAYFLYRLHVRN